MSLAMTTACLPSRYSGVLRVTIHATMPTSFSPAARSTSTYNTKKHTHTHKKNAAASEHIHSRQKTIAARVQTQPTTRHGGYRHKRKKRKKYKDNAKQKLSQRTRESGRTLPSSRLAGTHRRQQRYLCLSLQEDKPLESTQRRNARTTFLLLFATYTIQLNPWKVLPSSSFWTSRCGSHKMVVS